MYIDGAALSSTASCRIRELFHSDHLQYAFSTSTRDQQHQQGSTFIWYGFQGGGACGESTSGDGEDGYGQAMMDLREKQMDVLGTG